MARDDSLMNRFERNGLQRFSAREAVRAIALVALLLVLFEGGAIRKAGEQMDPGPGRDAVLLVGRPAARVADALPLHDAARAATAWVSVDPPLRAADRFAAAPAATTTVPPVTPDAFDPAQIGAPAPKRPLRTLLVTGDSLSTPLDAELARGLAGSGVTVVREPHLGTGISKSFVVDWGQLSASQVRAHHPSAVVLFIGANEGFPIAGARCCGPDWASRYANRIRRVTATYLQGGRARVFWITVPTPRDPDHARITRVVNAALEVAIAPWRAEARIIDTVPTFTPAGYRDAMPVDGRDTIVREADGIHLNATGAGVLAQIVLARLATDFTFKRR